MLDWNTIKLGAGLITAGIWAGVGWAVAKRNGEEFSKDKMVRTLKIGLFLGLGATVLGVDLATLEGMTILQLATILVDKLEHLLH